MLLRITVVLLYTPAARFEFVVMAYVLGASLHLSVDHVCAWVRVGALISRGHQQKVTPTHIFFHVHKGQWWIMYRKSKMTFGTSAASI